MILDYYDMDDEDDMKIESRILMFLVVFLLSMFYHFIATKTRREL
jgi:hypothetical protein